MSHLPLVPDDFVVPVLYDAPAFRLRKLSADDVDEDYEAVMESVDLLHAMFGRDWPTVTFTREENLNDLREHEQEFEQRQGFAYTVVTRDEHRCLGCAYIYPPRGYPADARVFMWVRQSEYDRGLDPVLFRTVESWLERVWPFEEVHFPGRHPDGSWFPLEGRSE